MIGLIFSGGGGKGAYEIGVWKALRAVGIEKNISSVSGTSVGALNATLFAMGDLDNAVRIWENISQDQVLSVHSLADTIIDYLISLGVSPNFKTAVLGSLATIGKFGMFSHSGLSALIEENIDYDYLRSFNGSVYACCTKLPALQKTYFNLTQSDDASIKNILLASAAIPVVFPSIQIDGATYIDGGINPPIRPHYYIEGHANIPIKPLYDEGIRHFIVVHLSDNSLIDKDEWKDSQFFEISPSESPGGLITGTLNFNSSHTKKLLELGYSDTLRILEPLIRLHKAGMHYSAALQSLASGEATFSAAFNEQEKTIQSQFDELTLLAQKTSHMIPKGD